MKLLANENFPLQSVKYLQQKGFDIRYIGTDYMGVSDKEVMALASRENRTILTFDRDYGELIFKHDFRPTQGVIYLRLKKFDSLLPGKIIETLFLNKGFNPEKSLSVVDERSIRQRKY